MNIIINRIFFIIGYSSHKIIVILFDFFGWLLYFLNSFVLYFVFHLLGVDKGCASKNVIFRFYLLFSRLFLLFFLHCFALLLLSLFLFFLFSSLRLLIFLFFFHNSQFFFSSLNVFPFQLIICE